jgi:hypothetical protein
MLELYHQIIRSPSRTDLLAAETTGTSLLTLYTQPDWPEFRWPAMASTKSGHLTDVL